MTTLIEFLKSTGIWQLELGNVPCAHQIVGSRRYCQSVTSRKETQNPCISGVPMLLG